MSFFPDMLKPASGSQINNFIVSINKFGECVITSLDAEGKPITFVATSTQLDTLQALAEAMAGKDHIADVIIKRVDINLCLKLFDPIETWAGLAEVLNGNSGVRKARAISRYRGPYRKFAIPFVSFDIRSRRYLVTEAGNRLDYLWHKENTSPPTPQTTTADNTSAPPQSSTTE